MWHRAAAMTPRFRHTHRVVRPHDPSRQASLRKHGHGRQENGTASETRTIQREGACLRLIAALVCHRRWHGDANGIGGNSRAGRDTRR